MSANGESGAEARPGGAVLAALCALALALAAVHLALPLASIPRLVALNYNEGWNGYHAEAVFSERPLYPPPADLFPNNYPPLSFALVAVAARAVGDPILTGRALSLLSFLAIAAQLAWLVRRSAGSWLAGLFAGALFAALLGAAFGDYVGMDDPQLLGHALMLGGVVLLVGGQTRLRLGGAAALMVLAGLVKHNLLAAPLALTCWLWLLDRRAFSRWAVAALAAAGAALICVLAIHGRDLLASLLGPRDGSLALGAQKCAEWLPKLAAPLALGLVSAPRAWREPGTRWLVLYAAFGLATGVVFSTGAGVNYNVFFDLVIALSALGALWLARSGPALPALALGAALLLEPLLAAPHALAEIRPGLGELAKLEAATWPDVQYLEQHEGPAICETLALCFWAGKPPGVDLFNSQQAFSAGVADEAQLIQRVSRGEFAVVQLTAIYKNRDDERLSLALTDALQLHYVVDRVSANGVFLRPRR